MLTKILPKASMGRLQGIAGLHKACIVETTTWKNSLKILGSLRMRIQIGGGFKLI